MAVLKKNARKICSSIKQGAYESILSSHDGSDIKLRVYHQVQASSNITIKPWTFFDRPDNGCYALFKTAIISGLSACSISQPIILNNMYLLSHQWLKMTGANQSGWTGKICLISNSKSKEERSESTKTRKGEGKAASRGWETQKDIEKVQWFECREKNFTSINTPIKKK